MNPTPPPRSPAVAGHERRIDRLAPTIVSVIATVAAAGLLVALMFVHGIMPTTTDGPGGLAILLFEWPVAILAGLTCLGAMVVALVAFRGSPRVNAVAFVVDVGIAFLLFGYVTQSPTWQQAARYFSEQHRWKTSERPAVDNRRAQSELLDRAMQHGSRFSLHAGPGATVHLLRGTAEAVRLDGSISASNAGRVRADFSLDAEIQDAVTASPGEPPSESTIRFKLEGPLDSQLSEDLEASVTQDFGNGAVREVPTRAHVWWKATASDQEVAVGFVLPATKAGDGLPSRRASHYSIKIVPAREPKSALDQWQCRTPPC